MDDKWFKKRQKIAGVTAEDIAEKLGRDRSVVSRIYVGRQKMKLDEAKIFADVLGVPLNEVLDRAGVLEASEAPQLAPGFAEGDAVPFFGKDAEKRRAQQIADIYGARPGIDMWQVKTNVLRLAGYVVGDTLLVDTHQAERCQQGDAVIAQIYDWQTGNANTVMRLFQKPFLVTHSGDMVAPIADLVDNSNVVIRGRIIASWRSVK